MSMWREMGLDRKGAEYLRKGEGSQQREPDWAGGPRAPGRECGQISVIPGGVG